MSRHLLIFLVSLAIVRASVGQNVSYEHNNNATWEENIRLSTSQGVRNIMNVSADPCQDYYQFACGNWRKYFPATIFYPMTSGLRTTFREFDGIVSNLLNSVNPNETASERKIRNFYKSCMNVSEMTQTEYRRSMKNLIREFGKMPALEGKKWQHKNFDWLKTVGEISHKYGVSIFLNFDKFAVRSSYELRLQPQKFVLTDTSIAGINKYKSTVENNLIRFLGIRKSIAKVTASQIAKLEGTLVKAAEQIEGENYLVDIEILKELPGLKLTKLLNTSFGYVPTGNVLIRNIAYLSELATIMKKTPKATLANYIFYHLQHEFATDLATSHFDPLCTSQIISFFPLIVSKMSLRAYQLQKSMQEYRDLMHDIVASTQNVLESDRLRWYDDKNREFALEKLHALKLYVAPFEDYDVDGMYEDLNVTTTNYMENIKHIKSFQAQMMRSTLDMAPDLLEQLSHLNGPAYIRTNNVVIFPISTLLTRSLMISYLPKSFKYSRMGYIIGHEITHAFSGDGRIFDKLGDYTGVVGDIENEVAERQNCLRDQYQSYEYIKTARHQQQNQDENIADAAGIALAYQSYSRWLADESRTKEELDMETLPHLNYTNKQLFFIYYSQTWCADYTAEYEATSLNDEHSIDPQRAVLPLANFNEFAKAFNCPLGSQMNPRKRCTLH